MPLRTCPCGHASCKDWHVEPRAAMQGVNFTEQEARMVAAAPDMLEALRGVSNALNNAFAADTEGREGGSARRQGKAIENYEAVRAACLAAIAKTEGR